MRCLSNDYVLPPSYTVTVTSGGNGTVTPTGAQSYLGGMDVAITATAAAGYEFDSWTSSTPDITFANPTSASTTMTVNGSGTVTANFAPHSYAVTVTYGTGGVSATGSGTYTHGQTGIAITATPATGYDFVNWTSGTTDITVANANSASTTITVTGPGTVTAAFAKKSYTVTIRAGTGGTVTPTGAQSYEHGTVVTIAATPASSYVFKNWTSSTPDITFADATSASTTMTVNGSGTVTANFDYPPAYIIYWDGSTIQVGQWGTVTQANMLFFKFGSVVGFYNNNNAWNQSYVVFEPSTTKATTYGNIPYWNGGAITTEGYISSSSYHTLASVRAGRGDPCKLVGLTIAQINSGTYDNGLWRLPTNAENVAHYGSGTQSVGTRGQSGHGRQRTGATNSFLPAAGRRVAAGDPTGVSSDGYYWSSRPRNASDGYRINFYSTAYPSGGNAHYGFAVRCVPQ